MHSPVEKARYPFWLLAGISVVIALSLLAVFHAYQTAGLYSTWHDPFLVNRQPERLADAARMLPPRAVVGYLSDLGFETTSGSAAYFGAQYALAPRLLTFRLDLANPEWVLGNFGRFQNFAALGAAHNLTLVRDFGNGVVLYRNRGH